MTAVQIGNYGMNAERQRSPPAQSAPGFVVRELSRRQQLAQRNSPSTGTTPLKKYGIPGISDIDTRALTKKLRVDGAMKGCLSTLPIADDEAIRRARSRGGTWPSLDYVKDVSVQSARSSGAPTTRPITTPLIFPSAPP